MYHVFYICSSVNGHLCILAIVNSAAVNTGACIFLNYIYLFGLWFSPNICPGVRLLDCSGLRIVCRDGNCLEPMKKALLPDWFFTSSTG